MSSALCLTPHQIRRQTHVTYEKFNGEPPSEKEASAHSSRLGHGASFLKQGSEKTSASRPAPFHKKIDGLHEHLTYAGVGVTK